MPAIKGTISGSILCEAINIPCTIASYSLVNNDSGIASVSVGVTSDGANVYIRHIHLAATGTEGSSSYENTNIVIPANAQILITSNKNVDYYFTIKGITYGSK